jgi:hypothetical protein
MRKATVGIAWVALLLAFSLPVFGQGTATSSINGTVRDASGAVIPGAEVKILNVATNQTFDLLTNDSGLFVLSAIGAGTYKVSVFAPGFKTTVIPDVKVDVNTPAAVNAVLEVGQRTDEVVVIGGQEIVNTATASIGTTVDQRRITELPLASRDALDLTTLQAGVVSTGRPRDSVVNGLRRAAINITIDGVNAQDNNLRSSDGYFTYIRPRIDAVEEFTITTSTAGADASGGGAVNVRFVTRSGSNVHHGSAYYYYRDKALNANYYFNNLNGLPKSQMRLVQPGIREGGPIIKDKLFYFANYEEYRLPEQNSRTRTILTANAAKGIFDYVGTDGKTYSADLLTLAGKKNFPSTIDPTTANYISTVNSNAKGGLNPIDPRTQQWNFQNTGLQHRIFPTARIDWKITSKISWEAIGNYGYFNSQPDFLNSYDRFAPGFETQGSQASNRWSTSTAVRWAISPQITNEARFGNTGGTSQFFRDVPVPARRIDYPIISDPYTYQPSSSRNAPGFHVTDNVAWNRGKHFLSMGMELNFYRRWQETVSGTSPLNTVSLTSADPANAGIFVTSDFPAISSTDLTSAKNLYALLVGRVSGVSANVYADEKTLKYVVGAPLTDRYKQNEVNFFIQDSWRFNPQLTLNLGLRYDLMAVPDTLNKLAVVPTGNAVGVYGRSGAGNLFKPGTLSGSPTMLELGGGPNGKQFYNDDWNNWAPSIAFNWNPNFSEGWLKKLFGSQGKSVIRGGYSISYIRDGFYNTTLVSTGNAGATATGSLTESIDFQPGALMLRNQMPALSVKPADFVFPTPQEPMRYTNNVYGWNPDLRVPYTQSWSLALEREIFKDTVMEFRYVGNHGTKLWRSVNLNEINIYENGFLKEFQSAQNNLKISRDAGKGANFRNQGLAGQVDLPIFTTAFGSATSTNFSSSTFINNLDNGAAGSTANTFTGSSYFPRFITAGYSLNFWKVNPDSTGAYLVSNDSDSNYHALQIELRRRMSKGVFLQANYTFGKSLAKEGGNSTGSNNHYTLRNVGMDYSRVGYDVTNRFNGNFIWEPPIGRGRSFWNSGVFGKIMEGWQFGGVIRVQSGNPFWITGAYASINQYTSGINATTARGDMQKKMTVRYDQANRRVYYGPADLVGSNNQASSSAFTPNTSAGSWGNIDYSLDGPSLFRMDFSVVKKTYITERINLEVRAEFMDVFNNINFLAPTSGVTSTSFMRITTAYQDTSTTNDPGGRWIQLVARISW